jgi:hypothetical protein
MCRPFRPEESNPLAALNFGGRIRIRPPIRCQLPLPYGRGSELRPEEILNRPHRRGLAGAADAGGEANVHGADGDVE